MKSDGRIAIEDEMERQVEDALASFASARERAAEIAASLRRHGRLLMLGMGGSHAVGRAVEPLYRETGIDAVAIPLSEQLTAPLPLDGKTIIVTSQSGESAEVLRWISEVDPRGDVFGLTLDTDSSLGRSFPSLVGAGRPELAFAATRSITISFALHLAVLAALGQDAEPVLAALRRPDELALDPGLTALASVDAIVTSGRRMQGLAEAIALGMTELARLPAFSLEGGQLRHGPPEMLGPEVGVVLFRSDEKGAELVASTAAMAAEAGSPVVLFDSSGGDPVAGAARFVFPRSAGMAAIFAMLPAAQRFMLEYAAARVPDVGTPRRSSKITRTE
jgi:fructoselysine-6-P-deglycase FrlB-like protein